MRSRPVHTFRPSASAVGCAPDTDDGTIHTSWPARKATRTSCCSVFLVLNRSSLLQRPKPERDGTTVWKGCDGATGGGARREERLQTEHAATHAPSHSILPACPHCRHPAPTIIDRQGLVNLSSASAPPARRPSSLFPTSSAPCPPARASRPGGKVPVARAASGGRGVGPQQPRHRTRRRHA